MYLHFLRTMKSPCVHRWLAVVLLVCAAGVAAAGEVEVLHYWTSGGEAKSVAELKAAMGKRGHSWKDFSVVGGGGQNAMGVLRQRVLEGSAPAAALIKGPTIQEWADLGVLTNLDTMAAFDSWDKQLPKVVSEHMKYKGHYVAVPVNVHRVNWLWVNSAVLQKAEVGAAPKTWDEFFSAADKVRAAGLLAVAHGGQDWQDFTTFESVVLGVGGTKLYQEALVKMEREALASDDFRRALQVFRRIKTYVDGQAKGRDWNVATEMVIKERAAFQFMGDWAKGEFLAAGKTPGKEFQCVPVPGTEGTFTYNVDSFAMFQLRNWEAQKAQGYLAYQLMGREFQEAFNLRKGSIPVRLGVPMERFDDCGKRSALDFEATAKAQTLLPSVAHGMALAPAAQASMRTAVSEFWNNDKMGATELITKLQSIPRNPASKTL